MNITIPAGGMDLLSIGIMLACLVTVSVFDIRSYIIPDIIVFPTIAAIVLVSMIHSPLAGVVSLVRAMVICGLLLVFSHLSGKGFGLGDVKLMSATALTLPLVPWLFAQIAALVFCLLVVVGYTALRWRLRGFPAQRLWAFIRSQPIPLAPYIGGGYLFALVLGLWLGR